MSNNIDPIESPEVFNAQLKDAIVNADNGILKRASEVASKMVRRRIRENGFGRLILPFTPATDAMLAPSLTSELPHIIEEMEPSSPGAKSVSFNDAADTAFFRGDKFAVYFYVITTREYTKSIDELRTYRSDLRGVITDNALKDMHTEEDANFIGDVDAIVGSVGGVGDSGDQQNFTIDAQIHRSNYGEQQKYLIGRNLNNGAWLMNSTTALTFLKWDRAEIGGDLAEKLFRKGLGALEEAEINGVRHIFTIKRDLVPDGVIYQFAEPGFLGKAYELQPITMYVEKKEDIIKFKAKEKIGLTFANTAALNRVQYLHW